MSDIEHAEVCSEERALRMLAAQVLVQLPERREDADAVLRMVSELLDGFIHRPSERRTEAAKPSLRVV